MSASANESAELSIYKTLDTYLGPEWELYESYGRLPDLSFARLLELYVDLQSRRFGPLAYGVTDIALYLGPVTDLSIILPSLLHAHKVLVDYPVRPLFWTFVGSPLAEFKTVLNGLKGTRFYDDPQADPYREMGRESVNPVPTKERLYNFFKSDCLPTLASLRRLVENELLAFFSPSFVEVPAILKSCLECCHLFGTDLHRILAKHKLAPVHNESLCWCQEWQSAGLLLTNSLQRVREPTTSFFQTREQRYTLLCKSAFLYDVTQLLYSYSYLIDKHVACHPFWRTSIYEKGPPSDLKSTGKHEAVSRPERLVVNRFLEHRLFTAWYPSDKLSVPQVVQIRRDSVAFEDWLLKFGGVVTTLKSCSDPHLCEERIRDGADVLTRMGQVAVKKLEASKSQTLEAVGIKGAVRMGLSFVAKCLLDPKELIEETIRTLVDGTISTASDLATVRGVLEGADLVLAQLLVENEIHCSR